MCDVRELAAPGGLPHHPLRRLVAVEPRRVVHEVAQHVRRPAGRRAVHRVNLADRAARDDRLHFLVVLAVAVLMADHRLHAGRVERLLDRRALRRSTSRPASRTRSASRRLSIPSFDERQPHVGGRAEAEDVRLYLRGQRLRHPCSSSPPPSLAAAASSRFWIPARRSQPARSGGWRRTPWHGACRACPCRRRRRGSVARHFAALSHSRTLATT